ncbi:IS66 family transposase, partial [Actinophytocola sp.]|uniref:IS66 family transposase n=1 Tax=Actinophytocola sp. TaxID=1872138 RepID=UPI002ED6BD2C
MGGDGDLGGDVGFWRAEAQRWRARAERSEAEAAQLRARVVELEGQVGALAEKVAELTRLAFGKSSEKQSAKKPVGRVEGEGGPDGPDSAEQGGGRASGRGRGQQKGSRGHGRRDYSHLPTEEHVRDVPQAERVCPRCGAGYVPFGEECCELIDWQVRVVRVVIRRPTYRRGCRCPVRGVLAAPPAPKPIAKGRFTSGFLARLLVEKFVLGRPTHRIAAALAHDGLDLADGTLAGVLAACSDLLAPLAAKISERNAAAAHLHVDETRWQVYAAVAGKDSHRWWLWVFAGPDTTVFTIAPSRSLKVLTTQLGITTDPDTAALPDILPGGRRLLLSSDFYTVYQSLGRMDGVDNLWCWSHIRRYFVRAGDAHPDALKVWTEAWLERIGALYRAHSALTAAAPGSPQQAEAAEQFDTALAAIDRERHTQAANAHLMHPAAVKVLATLDREWEGLARHREFPELPLDNNSAERALRGPVVGRKNFYGSGSKISAELAGRAWTITATAQRAGLNPLAYLGAYLHACAEAGGKPPTGAALDRFLPWT